MALRGIRTSEMPALEKLVMYEAYTQERMATVHQTAAIVFSSVDPKKAAELLGEYMNAVFPEVGLSKEKTTEAKIKELEEFSKHEVKLVPIPGLEEGFSLQVNPKETK